MALVVGMGNSVMFREMNGQLPSFDNTFLSDERFHNVMTYDQNAEYFTTDTIIIQVKVSTGDTPTLKWYRSDNTNGSFAGVLKTSYTDWDFWEFTLAMKASDDGKCFYFLAENAGDNDWKSENVSIITEFSTYYPSSNVSSYSLLQWFNLDATTARANNNFEMDYSTGIVPFMRRRIVLKDYEPKTEISVYENLSETTKLKEKVQRTLEMKTDTVPRYMAEKLVIATAHDNFYINQVSFIREDKPETEMLESNMAQFSAVLTQQNVIGLNTADIGFNCDSIVSCKVTNLEQTGVNANTTFTVPEGYLLHTITTKRTAGTNIYLKFGTTVGGDDVAKMRPSAADDPLTTMPHWDYSPSGDTTLYCDVSGTSVDVDIFIQLIDNRQ